MMDMLRNKEMTPGEAETLKKQMKDMDALALGFATSIKRFETFEGDTSAFGIYGAMFIANIFGHELIAKALDDLDIYKVTFALVLSLDEGHIMDAEKEEARKLIEQFDGVPNEDIARVMEAMGADQVDIDHMLMLLGREM